MRRTRLIGALAGAGIAAPLLLAARLPRVVVAAAGEYLKLRRKTRLLQLLTMRVSLLMKKSLAS